MACFRGFTATLIAVAALAVVSDTAAEQVVVRTNATSASGVVSQSNLVIAELERQAFSAPLFRVGDDTTSVVGGVFTECAYIWGVNARDESFPGSEVVELPLAATSLAAPIRFDVAAPIEAVKVTPAGILEAELAVVAGASAEGMLLLFAADEEGHYLTSAPRQVGLPGRPLDLAWLRGLRAWGVLCESASGPSLEVVAADERRSVPVMFERPTAAPQRIVTVGDAVVVLAAGYDLDRADGAPVTLVQKISETDSGPRETLSVAGALVASPDAVVAADAESIWVTTESPGTGSATASRVTCSDSLRVEAVISLPTTAESFCAAATPDKRSIAFASGRLLQLCRADGEKLNGHRFPAAVRVLEWRKDALIVGEGNRVHRVDADRLVPDRTIHLYSGQVVEVGASGGPLPALGDADGDNVLDSIDESPGRAVPALVMPRQIRMRREAAGLQTRAVNLGLSASLRGYRYGVAPPEHEGVTIDPLDGALPGVLNVRLEPAYWRSASGEFESIPIRVSVLEESSGNVVSSDWLEVAVGTASPVPARVLLIPGTPDEDFRQLVVMLQRPPHYYSVTLDPSPAPDSLGAYHVVGVSMEAVLSGRIPRVHLERYTASGGGLFLLGSASTLPRLDDARAWLTPFRIDVRSAPASVRAVRQGCDWCDVWAEAGLGKGLLASVEPPGKALFMPGRAAREGPMVRAPLGLGRMVFAGASGLIDAAAASPAVHEALVDALQWLARTRIEVSDRDGDGLADDVEDRDGDGVVDPDETDPRHADTDRDLVLDGLEDANGNGRVDEGETDPLEADTDRDRVPDGADTHPVPPAGTRNSRDL